MWLIIKVFVLLSFIFIVQSQSKSEQGQACVITEDELMEVEETVSSLSDQQSKKKLSSCDGLLTAVVDKVISLKDGIEAKIEKSDKNYNQTEMILKSKEQNLIAELEEIPSEYQAKYKSDIDEMTKELTKLKKLIDELNFEQEKYDSDFSYYLDYLNNGTKFSSRFDSDSFFEESKKCSFRRNRVQLLLNELNEIFTLTQSDSYKIMSNECFSECRNKIGNLETIIEHRVGDEKIKSLKSTYDERSKLLRKLIDDYTLQHEQFATKNLTQMSDSYQALKQEYETLKIETKKKKRETAIKGFQTVKRMILEGTKFRKAREIFLNIRGDILNSFANILNKTYDCEANNLQATMRFALLHSRYTGYAIIKDKMKDCGQLTSPFILEIASLTKDESLNETIDEVYEGWVSQIRHGKYDQIEDFMRYLSDDVISFRKLFQTALKSNPSDIKSLLLFIDDLDAYTQKIVIDLYDEMMDHNLAFTPVHMEICRWIREKLKWIHQQLSNSAITGDLKEHLDILIEKIPIALKTFIFEPSVILATKGDAYQMRSDTHLSVNFKVIPDSSGKFYRFEDLNFGKSFYASKFEDVKSNEEKIRVRLGTENTENYYWSLSVSSENKDFFHLENKKFTGFFLSSLEDNVCKEKKYWGSCKTQEWMNRVYPDKLSNTEWTFTTRLRRLGILADRFNG